MAFVYFCVYWGMGDLDLFFFYGDLTSDGALPLGKLEVWMFYFLGSYFYWE
jgi:hypothetical protein